MRIVLCTAFVAGVVCAAAGTAAASHIGGELVCDGFGEPFTITGTRTGAGFDVPIGETNLFLLGDTNSVYVIKATYVGDNPTPRFQVPGFIGRESGLVRCTLTGPSGTVYTNYGIFT